MCADYRVLSALRELSEEEDQLTPTSKAFLSHSLSAVPVRGAICPYRIGHTCTAFLSNSLLAVPALPHMLL